MILDIKYLSIKLGLLLGTTINSINSLINQFSEALSHCGARKKPTVLDEEPKPLPDPEPDPDENPDIL